MSVRIGALRKTYARDVVALDDATLDVADGELIVVVGPSGSGKTTLLRCVAGLEDVDSGTVEIAGRDVTDVAPGKRNVSMVFQELALFPHMSVRDNIAFGMAARGERGIDGAVARAAALLELEPVLQRLPAQLSGGERQRVALARAIVRDPALFLMDEPLSNLDPELRMSARSDIRTMQRELGTTTIYVTHDQVEAMTLGDRVAVIRAGRIEQVGRPVEIYDHPATEFVARFFGTPPMNLFPAELIGRADVTTLGIRPENVRLSADAATSGVVEVVEVLGPDAAVRAAVAGIRFFVRAPRDSAPEPGAEVGLELPHSHLHAFDADGRAMP